jgi:rhodanese-related sulfurtransferase
MINASGNTLIIDIRDELSFEYGHIDGAVNIPVEKLDKKWYIPRKVCTRIYYGKMLNLLKKLLLVHFVTQFVLGSYF